jgi:hypothetical protein
LAEADEACSIRLAWRIRSSWAWVARRWVVSCLWEVRICERSSSSSRPGLVPGPDLRAAAVEPGRLGRGRGSPCFLARVDLDDARLVDLLGPGVSVVSAGLVVRGEAAVGRCPRAGAGVAGVLDTVPGADEARSALGEAWLSSFRAMSGDLNGFLRVALAASIRRRLAAGPPGV